MSETASPTKTTTTTKRTTIIKKVIRKKKVSDSRAIGVLIFAFGQSSKVAGGSAIDAGQTSSMTAKASGGGSKGSKWSNYFLFHPSTLLTDFSPFPSRCCR